MGLISGIFGFLGARQNNKTQERLHARDSYNNSPQGIRANAEDAGFNPLTVLTAGRQYGAGYTPTFENAAAHLGRGIEEAFTGELRQKLQLTQLKKQNHQLQQRVENTTFKTDTPGIYERRRSHVLESGNPPVSGGGSVYGNSASSVTGEHDDIPSILVPWRAENGEIVMLPNPDLPDADQYVPAIAGGGAASIQDWLGIGSRLPDLPTFGDFFGSSKRRTTRSSSTRSPKPPKPTRQERLDYLRDNYPSVFD